MMDTVNNLFLETFHIYTDRIRTIGTDNSKCLVIYFSLAENHDAYIISTFANFLNLKFYAYDFKQLQLTEN